MSDVSYGEYISLSPETSGRPLGDGEVACHGKRDRGIRGRFCCEGRLPSRSYVAVLLTSPLTRILEEQNLGTRPVARAGIE